MSGITYNNIDDSKLKQCTPDMKEAEEQKAANTFVIVTMIFLYGIFVMIWG